MFMIMEAYKVMDLFESCWFEHQIFKRPKSSAFSSFGSNPDPETRENSTTFRFGFFSPYWLRLTIHSGEENDDASSLTEMGEPTESLSDLEELRGFMDLGFVFSEEDKDSRLASVIPGLQKLGKKGSSLNWVVPSLRNETDMKDSLKWWAHEVASTVTRH